MTTPVDTVSRLGRALLEVGATLMSSGANTARVRKTMERIASAFDCQVEVFITHRALMLTLSLQGQTHFYSSLKRISPHGVNFRVVSGISRMSWRVVEERWALAQVEEALEHIRALPHFRRWQVLLAVSLAGASFCRLFGGGAIEMGVTFVATLAGLFLRQEAMRLNYNPYVCIFVAATASSLISGSSVLLQLGEEPHYALATSVLYLIPGVPLINSSSDLVDGNILNGIVRGINGLIISFAIAFGLLVAFLVYGIDKI